MSAATIAMNRFGLGGRARETPPADPRRWLLDQFDRYDARPAAIAAQPRTLVVGAEVVEYRRTIAMARRQVEAPAEQSVIAPTPAAEAMRSDAPDPAADARRMARREGRGDLQRLYAGAVGARVTNAVETPTPFVERLVHFWANHFAVSADGPVVTALTGAFEFDAIRPHVLGKFADMLMAAERHPAMLMYLNQAQSVGPDSPVARRIADRGRRQAGLNENLAREILELHTLGVRTGYGQADVTELARAMTGWTVAGLGRGGRRGQPGSAIFAPALHQPGDRMVLGRRYAAGLPDQSGAILADLATAPATARHVATKLVRHFVADEPPVPAVARVEAAFLQSGGDLSTTYRALIAAPEAWGTPAPKFRTPWDWTIAAMRAVGTRAQPPRQTVGLLTQLGQPVWRPRQPSGYDDVAGSWAAPDALMRRVEAAERLAGRAPEATDARTLAERLFPDTLGDATRQALARAESPGQGLALLLCSPEFLRR